LKASILRQQQEITVTHTPAKGQQASATPAQQAAPAAPAAPSSLDELQAEFSKESRDANNLKAQLAALQTAIQDVKTNKDQFAKDGPGLQKQADQDTTLYQHLLQTSKDALGDQVAAKVRAVWTKYDDDVTTAKGAVDDATNNVADKTQKLKDAHKNTTDAQGTYNDLKVASFKANLQALEQLLSETNKANLPAVAYFLLQDQASKLIGPKTKVPDPDNYEKSLVAAFDAVAAAQSAERTAQNVLDDANSDLAAKQQYWQNLQANRKQTIIQEIIQQFSDAAAANASRPAQKPYVQSRTS
jgi:hypothetical protein